MAEYTKSEILRLENEICSSQTALNLQKERLERIRKACQHVFGPTVADHIYHKGYHIAGDAPGTMGVDRQLSMDVPARTEKRWKRVCELCAKIEYTQRVVKNVSETPQW